MITDENNHIMSYIDRIAMRAYFYLTVTSRYLFSDSRQRIVFTYYVLIYLCFFTPTSSSFVLYQGTTPKLEYKELNMLRTLKQDDRKVIMAYCRIVLLTPNEAKGRISQDQLIKSVPICESLVRGIRKVKDIESKRPRNL